MGFVLVMKLKDLNLKQLKEVQDWYVDELGKNFKALRRTTQTPSRHVSKLSRRLLAYSALYNAISKHIYTKQRREPRNP